MGLNSRRVTHENVFLCVTDLWRNESITPPILYLDSEPYGGEFSASLCGCFTPGEGNPCTCCVGVGTGWVWSKSGREGKEENGRPVRIWPPSSLQPTGRTLVVASKISAPVHRNGWVKEAALCFTSPCGSFSRDSRPQTIAPHTSGARTLPRRSAPHRDTIPWRPPTSPPTPRLRLSAGRWLRSWIWGRAGHTSKWTLCASVPGSEVGPWSWSTSPETAYGRGVLLYPDQCATCSGLFVTTHRLYLSAANPGLEVKSNSCHTTMLRYFNNSVQFNSIFHLVTRLTSAK